MYLYNILLFCSVFSAPLLSLLLVYSSSLISTSFCFLLAFVFFYCLLFYYILLTYYALLVCDEIICLSCSFYKFLLSLPILFNCSTIAFFHVFLSSSFVIFYCLTFCSSCHLFTHSLFSLWYDFLRHLFFLCWLFLVCYYVCFNFQGFGYLLCFFVESAVVILFFLFFYHLLDFSFFNINVAYCIFYSAGHIPVSINSVDWYQYWLVVSIFFLKSFLVFFLFSSFRPFYASPYFYPIY